MPFGLIDDTLACGARFILGIGLGHRQPGEAHLRNDEIALRTVRQYAGVQSWHDLGDWPATGLVASSRAKRISAKTSLPFGLVDNTLACRVHFILEPGRSRVLLIALM